MTTTLTAPAPAPTTVARREIMTFVVVQALLGLAATTVAAAQGVDVRRISEAPALGQVVTYGMAFTPLVAALVARLATLHSLRGFGFRRVGWRVLLLCWAIGLTPVLAAYTACWTTGVGRFEGTPTTAVLAGTVLVVPYLLLALAEDVGWRGLLVTRLAQLTRRRTVYLVSGVLWSLSHLGLIVVLGGTPEGVPPLVAAASFTIATTALGSILAAMQLRWGIWPGVVTHATVNAVMYHFAEPATGSTGPLTNWITTETGLAYAAAMAVAALVSLRKLGRRAAPAGHQPSTSGAGNPC